VWHWSSRVWEGAPLIWDKAGVEKNSKRPAIGGMTLWLNTDKEIFIKRL
jgi:hypothetical protein